MSALPTLAGVAAALALALGAAGALAEGPPGDGLAITFRDGQITVRRILVCSPAPAGTLPDPAGACAGLRAGALDPPATGPDGFPRVCIALFAGPETIRVRGTFDGRAVDAAFDRRDGCRAADFQALVTALAGGPGRPDPLGPRLRVRAVRTAVGVRLGRPVRVPIRVNRAAGVRVTVTAAGGRRAMATGSSDARRPIVLRTGGAGAEALRRGNYVIRVTAVDYLGGRATAPPIRLRVR